MFLSVRLFLFVLVMGQISGLSPESWMGDSVTVIGSRTLLELTLPGTHDSGLMCDSLFFR